MLPFVTLRLDIRHVIKPSLIFLKLQNSPIEFDIGLKSHNSKVRLIPTDERFRVYSFEHITIQC